MSPLTRRRQAELMDEPALDPQLHHAALRGLRRINLWSRSTSILWSPLAALAREMAPQPLRILDVATGGGDVPIRLEQWARRAGLTFAIDACDRSPVAVSYARDEAHGCQSAVRFFVADALAEALPAGYDAAICSLFLHHLEDDQAVALLRHLASAARLVLVNDLVRSRTGLLLAHIATRLLTLSPVVHTDGPRSVEGAYRPEEVLLLAARAALDGARVTRHWPCRFLLTWRRA